MLFTTPTQYIALAVALVAGWLFGLASHPGGKKWKARYAAERDAHAVTGKRVTELERDNARLATATPAPVVEERVMRDERVAPVRDDPARDGRAVGDDRVVGDGRVVRDDRRDDRVVARSAAEPARPVNPPII